jgi:hypothetical protein
MGDQVTSGHHELEVGEVGSEGLTGEAHACEGGREVFLIIVVRSFVVSLEGTPEHLFDRMTAILGEFIERHLVLALLVTRRWHPPHPFESDVGGLVKPHLLRRSQQVFE